MYLQIVVPVQIIPVLHENENDEISDIGNFIVSESQLPGVFEDLDEITRNNMISIIHEAVSKQIPGFISLSVKESLIILNIEERFPDDVMDEVYAVFSVLMEHEFEFEDRISVCVRADLNEILLKRFYNLDEL